MIVHFWYKGFEKEYHLADSVRFNGTCMIVTDSELKEYSFKAKKVEDLSIESTQENYDPFYTTTTWDSGAIDIPLTEGKRDIVKPKNTSELHPQELDKKTKKAMRKVAKVTAEAIDRVMALIRLRLDEKKFEAESKDSLKSSFDIIMEELKKDQLKLNEWTKIYEVFLKKAPSIIKKQLVAN